MKVIERMEFNNIDKDRVYNWVTGNRSADFINGEPVLRIQTLSGIEIARLGDIIEKKEDGYCYVKKD